MPLSAPSNVDQGDLTLTIAHLMRDDDSCALLVVSHEAVPWHPDVDERRRRGAAASGPELPVDGIRVAMPDQPRGPR